MNFDDQSGIILDEEGSPTTEIVRLVGGRMIQAGWAEQQKDSPPRSGVAWTPEGLRKLSQLHELLRELQLETMSKEDLWALRTLCILQVQDGQSAVKK